MDRSDAQTSRRVLRIAVLGSVLVHVVGFFLWGIGSRGFAFIRPFPAPSPTPAVIVTTSNAITIEKRAKPQPAPVPVPRHAAAREAPPQQQVQPHVAVVQPNAVARPQVVPHPVEAPPKSRELHELAKQEPAAAPEPPKTVKATASPHPEPTQPATATEPQKIAYNERSSRPSRAQLSQAQLAHIGQDIAKTLTELHKEDDPLAVHPTAQPVTDKRYRVQMVGIAGDLHHGEGHYFPIKRWDADGYHYYYVSYDFVYPDGTYEQGGVPWPVRFRPAQDPFAHPELIARHETPLAPPLPGWTLPPGESIGKALTLTFPQLHGQQSGGQQQPEQRQ